MFSEEKRCPASREQFKELHAHQARKASTAEMYRAMGGGSYDYTQMHLDLNLTNEEAQKLWSDTGKPERYTLMRYISKPIIDATYENFRYFPAKGVLDILESNDSIQTTEEIIAILSQTTVLALYHEMDDYLEELGDRMITTPSDPGALAYKKHLDWVNFFNRKQPSDSIVGPGSVMEERATIGSGFKTGTIVMAGVLKVLPVLLYEAKGRKVTISECLETAENSETLLNSMAVLDVPTFQVLSDALDQTKDTDPFDHPSNFALSESDKGYRVELAHDTLEKALGSIALTENQEKLRETRRVRCPGLLNGGITTLWRWYQENAEILWQEGVLHSEYVENRLETKSQY